MRTQLVYVAIWHEVAKRKVLTMDLPVLRLLKQYQPDLLSKIIDGK
jgi:hypothetical protein